MYRLVQRAVEEAWGGLCAIWETCEVITFDPDRRFGIPASAIPASLYSMSLST